MYLSRGISSDGFEQIIKLLNNTWFVSIVGGILSGILSYVITTVFIEKRGKQQFLKIVSQSNQDVINYLRNYVVDNKIPSITVINAVKSGISKQNNIDIQYLLSVKNICELLITEIISNVYISSSSKEVYIKMLEKYMEDNKDEIEEDNRAIATTYKADIFKKLVPIVSFATSLISFLSILFSNFFN